MLLVKLESLVKSDTFVGIVGVPIKSEYVPVFATLCKVILPLNASLAAVLCAVVAVVFNVPGAEGTVTVFLVAVNVKSPSVAVVVPVKLSTYVIVPLVEVAVPFVVVSLCFACEVNVPSFFVNPQPDIVDSVGSWSVVARM